MKYNLLPTGISLTVFFLIFLLTASTVFLFSRSEDSEAWKTSLEKAEKYFQEGLDNQTDSFFLALDEYNKAMESGAPRDARIYYNWGNALYMTGFTPKAALQYKRALYLKPGDSKIRENLLLTRRTQSEAPNNDLLHKVLFAPIFLSGYKEALYTGLFLFSLSWILLTTGLFIRKKTGVYFLVLFCLSLSILSVCGIWHYKALKTGVILTQDASLRKGDSNAYDLIGNESIPGGAVFQLLEERNGWQFIRLENNQEGWIESTETRMLLDELMQP